MNVQPALPDKLQLDAEGRIAEDIHCRACGYNLRSLDPNGICPECGTAVGRSVHGDLLRFCDPTWVGRLASGMNWIVAGIVCHVLTAVLAASVAGFIAATTGSMPEPQSGWVAFLYMPAALVNLIGCWRVTTPEPRRLEQESTLSARRLVRFTFVATFVLEPIANLLDQSGAPISEAIGLLVGTLGLVGLLAVFVYARQLALRIPDDRLAKHTLMQAIILISMTGMRAAAPGGSAGAGIATRPAPPVSSAPAPAAKVPPPAMRPGTASAPAAPSATGGSPGSGPAPIGTTPPPAPAAATAAGFAGVACVIGIAYLFFVLWAVRLLTQYRRNLRAAAQLAAETWARSSQSPSGG